MGSMGVADRRTFIFDGGLPARKRDERAKRYQSLLSDAIRNSTGKMKKYLPPPFVVSACQQTLLPLSQKHGFVMRLVPEEADGFCVRLSREENNGYIVSADGDFLVYVGERGTFVPLQMFPWRWDGSLAFTAYSNIREGLKITRPNGLVELAALLIEGVDRSIPQLIQVINKNQTLDYLSREQLHDYISAYTAIETLSTPPESSEYFEAGMLPGRVTELFCGEDVPVLWLPLLPITNPPRKDPWPISRHIRQAAYFVLQKKGVIRGNTVTEMIRRGERIVPEMVEISDTDIDVSTTRESVFVTAMKVVIENVADEDLRYLPVIVGMYTLLGEPSQPPSFSVVPPTLQYITVQYQSIIYSLIILLQSKFPTSTKIPVIASLYDFGILKTAMTKTITGGEELWAKITEGMGPGYQFIGNKLSTPEDYFRKKSTRSKSQVPTEQHPQRNSNNPFAVLSTPNFTVN